MKNKKRIIILAPHTDDGEFGCGATISKLSEKGSEIYYVAFSIAEESVPPEFSRDILKTEVKKAINVLGVKKENLILFNYRVRQLASSRQEILEDLVKLNKEIKPDLVFQPSFNDLHQDHSTVANEGIRAFKKTSVLGYEMPWNNLNFHTQCFSEITEANLNCKINALKCYESQLSKSYASEIFIKSLAITRGTQIGCDFAEVFEVVRWKI
tara:strand:+ start:832 stop:1464 length:633 start_codon:yes stop_codon:yes gene_type:complete